MPSASEVSSLRSSPPVAAASVASPAVAVADVAVQPDHPLPLATGASASWRFPGAAASVQPTHLRIDHRFIGSTKIYVLLVGSSSIRAIGPLKILTPIHLQHCSRRALLALNPKRSVASHNAGDAGNNNDVLHAGCSVTWVGISWVGVLALIRLHTSGWFDQQVSGRGSKASTTA